MISVTESSQFLFCLLFSLLVASPLAAALLTALLLCTSPIRLASPCKPGPPGYHAGELENLSGHQDVAGERCLCMTQKFWVRIEVQIAL